jgi:hypothetical protein
MQVSRSSVRVPSPITRWAVLCLGLAFLVRGAAGVWQKLDYSVHGLKALGRVITFNRPRARSMEVVAQLEVTLPGRAPFPAEIDDNLNSDNWVEGETMLPLRCRHSESLGFSCSVDSGAEGFLIPIAILAAGVGLVWWGRSRGVASGLGRQLTEDVPTRRSVRSREVANDSNDTAQERAQSFLDEAQNYEYVLINGERLKRICVPKEECGFCGATTGMFHGLDFPGPGTPAIVCIEEPCPKCHSLGAATHSLGLVGCTCANKAIAEL